MPSQNCDFFASNFPSANNIYPFPSDVSSVKRKKQSAPDKYSSSRNKSQYESAYKVFRFLKDGKIRHIVQHTKSFSPSPSVSYYEASFTNKAVSPNTILSKLEKICFLLTWAECTNFPIEHVLLNGEMPSAAHVRSFAHWLNNLGLKKERINAIIDASSCMFIWFIRQFNFSDGTTISDVTPRELGIQALKEIFRDEKSRIKKTPYALDLSDESLEIIDDFLNPKNRTNVHEAVALRDYLMWRLAREFGFRQGEILALRLCDCPHRGQNYIRIVRIEERGPKYFDPRGKDAPRPKTLSRDLSFLDPHSPIPRLIGEYVTRHRFTTEVRLGNKVNKLVSHDFLILSHHNGEGGPLSLAGMRKVAAIIRKKTGIDFNWHLLRHAFFNRRYRDITSVPNHDAQLDTLVYFGGWKSRKSLYLYINAALKDMALNIQDIWIKEEAFDE